MDNVLNTEVILVGKHVSPEGKIVLVCGTKNSKDEIIAHRTYIGENAEKLWDYLKKG